MKHLLYFFFLGTFLSSFSLQGQASFHTNGSQAMNFYCDYKNSPGNSSARDILSILSGEGGHEVVGFHINYTRNHDIARAEGKQQVKFNAWLNNIHVSAPVLYKGFNVATFLMPTSVELNVKAYRGHSRLFNACWTSQIKRGKTSNMDKKHRDTLDGYTLQVEEIKFKFNSTIRSELKDYIRNIDAYETAAFLVNKQQRLLNEFNWQNPDPETLEEVQVDFENIGIDIGKIKDNDFWASLPLQRNDPLALRLNFEAFEQNYERNKQKIDRLLARIHELYQDKARYYYQKGQLAPAKRLADKALSKQSDYLPSKVLLVELEAQEEAWYSVTKEATYLLNHKSSQMNLEDKQRLLAIIAQIVIRNVSKGQEDAINKEYYTAIDYYDRALDLIDNTKGYKGSKVSILTYKMEAVKDWMDMSIAIAKKKEAKAATALENKDIEASASELENVLDRIVSAKLLNQEYKLNAPIDLGAWEIKTEIKIFDQATIVAKRYVQSENWDKARDYAHLAYSVSLNGQEEEAYVLYRKVEYQSTQEIELRYQVTKEEQVENIDLAIKSRAKQAVLDKIPVYLKSKNNSEIEQAKTEIVAYVSKYKIENDPAMVSAIEKLSDWKCANAQGEFDAHKAYLAKLLEDRKFYKAQKEFNQLSRILKKYPDCSIDASKMPVLEQDINICFDYHRLVANFRSFPESISLKWCQEHIAAAEEINKRYLHPSVQVYFEKPDCLDLYPYLYSKKRSSLLFTGAEYYRKIGTFDHSFALFKEAVRMDSYYKNQNYTLQEQLGTIFANQHYDENKHWKIALFEFTGELHKGLPKFDKAFKIQWLKIKRLKRL